MTNERRERCPTCRARRRGPTPCHRCGSDLGPLQAVEARADRLLASARRAYRYGFFRNAARHAAASARQETREHAVRLFAVSCIRSGDFRAGVRAARSLLTARNEANGTQPVASHIPAEETGTAPPCSRPSPAPAASGPTAARILVRRSAKPSPRKKQRPSPGRSRGRWRPGKK